MQSEKMGSALSRLLIKRVMNRIVSAYKKNGHSELRGGDPDDDGQ